jgi:hypothetical protein
MQIPISHSRFEGQILSVETGGFFRGARVLHNGNPVEKRKGRYLVHTNRGERVLIRLKGNFLDPIPKVIFGNETIVLARPLTWYEYIWIGFPILLVFAGGAIGGLVGGMATYASARIFRSDRGALTKYGITSLISVVSVVAFVILVLAAQQMAVFHNNTNKIIETSYDKPYVVVYGRDSCGWTQKYFSDLRNEGIEAIYKSVDNEEVCDELEPRMEKAGLDTRSYYLPVIDANGQIFIRPELNKVLEAYKNYE